jgi:hypothetical protein
LKDLQEVEKLSFQSVFLPLSPKAALEIVESHQKWRGKGNEDLKCLEQKDNGELYNVDGEKLEELSKLCQEIDTQRKSLRTPNFFIRLSTRSPKDAVLTSQVWNFTHLPKR